MNNIAMLRKEHKLNQKELGVIIGVAQNTICNWENGKREPDFLSLEKMASYFHCSVDYLLGRTEQKEQPTSENGDGLSARQREAVQFIKGLSDEQLVRFIRLGRAAFEAGDENP